jgi:hypothetical protein
MERRIFVVACGWLGLWLNGGGRKGAKQERQQISYGDDNKRTVSCNNKELNTGILRYAQDDGLK